MRSFVESAENSGKKNQQDGEVKMRAAVSTRKRIVRFIMERKDG